MISLMFQNIKILDQDLVIKDQTLISKVDLYF